MEIVPSASLVVNGHTVTARQIEALLEVARSGSQRAASEAMGISLPVLHRHIAALERATGERFLMTSPTGTTLTVAGEELVREYLALEARLGRRGGTVVGCTIITEELLLSALSRLGDGYELIISDDVRNLRDFEAGLMDLAVVDDPLYLYEIEGILSEEVAEDELVHVDRGERYLGFRYGAQRIGFRQLEADGVVYSMVGETRSVGALVESPYSFFVNQSLLSRKGIRLRSHTPTERLHHTINALYRSETHEIAALLRELRAARK